MNSWQTFVIGVLASLPTVLAGLATFLEGMRRIRGVHDIVNSQRTVMVQQIDDLKKEVVYLKEVITKSVRTDDAGGQGWDKM